MKVQEIMTKDVGFCTTEDFLTKAAEIMWQKDCGIVPIINAEKIVVGMLTDRDICFALTTRNARADEIRASEVIGQSIIKCAPEDNIKDVLKKMRKYQIKRLPVTSQNGELIGIISLTDVLFATYKDKSLTKKLDKTIKEISKPRPILLREVG